MSELVEKVQDAIFEAYDFNGIASEKMSRAAIAAVAEWLERSGSMKAAVVGNALRNELEQPE